MTTNIRPINYLILVKPDEPEQISSMIAIPDENKKQSTTGTVLAVGKRVTQVEIGERIQWEELAGKEIEGEGLMLVDEEKVLFAYGSVREAIN